jgi:hypothetical protein
VHRVDLHQHGHRPGESLVRAQEHVRGDDEAPGRREADEQRHRQRECPAQHEQPLASRPLGERAGGEVRQSLGGPERDDEGEDRGLRREPEVALADERKDAPLEPDHRTDERVQPDEQRELRRVCP